MVTALDPMRLDFILTHCKNSIYALNRENVVVSFFVIMEKRSIKQAPEHLCATLMRS
jgi:hypothetical protein